MTEQMMIAVIQAKIDKIQFRILKLEDAVKPLVKEVWVPPKREYTLEEDEHGGIVEVYENTLHYYISIFESLHKRYGEEYVWDIKESNYVPLYSSGLKVFIWESVEENLIGLFYYNVDTMRNADKVLQHLNDNKKVFGYE